MIRVYRNLSKNCWSIQEKGKVVAHAEHVILENVKPKVSEAGRLRVLSEKKKNVHAYLECDRVYQLFGKIRSYKGRFPSKQATLMGSDYLRIMDLCKERVSYNPYKNNKFVIVLDDAEYQGSLYAYLNKIGQVYI